MANYNGINYAKQYITKPSEKIDKGELAGRKRLLKEKYTFLTGVTYAVGDRILGPKIPKDSIVTNAKIRIEATTGSTGIFDLGHLASANGDHAEDTDAFIVSADSGGQAVLKSPAAANVGIFKRFTEEVQIVLIATEATPSMAGDVIIHMEVEYVND